MSETTKSPQQLTQRTAIMALGTTLSRATGFIRVMVFVAALGVTRISDAYTLANNTPNIIYELILGGVLSATLLPVFVLFQNESEQGMSNGVSAIYGLTFVVLGIVAAIFFFGAPLIINMYTIGNHSKNIGATKDVGIYLLRFFAPQVLFYGFITVATAHLNAKRKFAAPMFAPILNNLVVIAMFAAFRHLFVAYTLGELSHHRAPLIYLGVLTTFGVVAMALALLPSMLSNNLLVRPRWNPKHPAVKRVISLSGWTFGFVLANQLVLLLTLALATYTVGGPTAYTVAYIFFLLPHGIFAVSVMSALQPELAQAWAENNLGAFRHHVSTGIRWILLVIVPASVGLIMLARPIVQLTLGYGQAKSTHELLLISGTVAWMCVGLAGFSIFLFLTRCFQAMHDAKTVFYIYLLENGINAVGAFAVYRVFGVRGLGFVFGLSYIVAALVAFAILRKRIGQFPRDQIVNAFGFTLLASVGMAAIIAIVMLVTKIQKAPPLFTVVVALGLAMPTYFVLTRVFGLKESNYLLRGPLRRFAKEPE